MEGYVIKPKDVQLQANEDRSTRLRCTLHQQTIPGIEHFGGLSTISAKSSSGSHSHEKDEIFFIMGGKAKVVLDGEETLVVGGDTIFVPGGCEHEFVNDGDEDFDHFFFFPSWPEKARSDTPGEPFFFPIPESE